MTFIRIALLGLLFHACASTPAMQRPQATVTEVAQQKLGKNITLDYNASQTYVIAHEKREGDHSRRIFRYVILKVSDKQVVEEGSYQGGHIRWLDDGAVEVMDVPDVQKDAIKKVISVGSKQP